MPAAGAVGEIESLVSGDEKIVAAKPGQRPDFRAQQAGSANLQPEPVRTLARSRKKSRLSGNKHFIRTGGQKTVRLRQHIVLDALNQRPSFFWFSAPDTA